MPAPPISLLTAEAAAVVVAVVMVAASIMKNQPRQRQPGKFAAAINRSIYHGPCKF